MLTTFLDQRRTWVFTPGAATPIGRWRDMVIDPANGKAVALWIQTPRGMQLLERADISQWRSRRIIISDPTTFFDPAESPKFAEAFKKEIPIIGNKVFHGKKYLGKVHNFGFDTISPQLTSLIVRSGYLWWRRERIIPRQMIQKITQEGIFIAKPRVKIKLAVKKKAPGPVIPTPEAEMREK